MLQIKIQIFQMHFTWQNPKFYISKKTGNQTPKKYFTTQMYWSQTVIQDFTSREDTEILFSPNKCSKK